MRFIRTSPPTASASSSPSTPSELYLSDPPSRFSEARRSRGPRTVCTHIQKDGARNPQPALTRATSRQHVHSAAFDPRSTFENVAPLFSRTFCAFLSSAFVRLASGHGAHMLVRMRRSSSCSNPAVQRSNPPLPSRARSDSRGLKRRLVRHSRAQISPEATESDGRRPAHATHGA